MSNRLESIDLFFPEQDLRIECRLLWQQNPELCELLLRHLPFETYYSHAMATGEGMYAPTRIGGSVPGVCELITEMAPGTLTLQTTNYKSLAIWYGPTTEPLPTTAVAVALERDLPKLIQAGHAVWQATLSRSQPVTAVVSAHGA